MKNKLLHYFPGLTIIAALLLFSQGCGQGSVRGAVVVLGLDGMDPRVVDLLVSEGKMPNFARLRREGAYGRLISQKPLLSPVIWTTIATGKTPDKHRIGHFVAVNEKTGKQLPVISRMRRVKAVWNIFSEAERQVGVVGWWATWPAETVRGAIISDHTCYHFLFEEGVTGGTGDLTGNIYPPALEKTIAPLIRRPADLKPEDVSPFISVSAEEFSRPFDFNDDTGHFKWALATAESYSRIGLRLLKEDRSDLLMVYIEGTDSVSHLFGHLFRARGLAGELAEQQKRFGRAVEAMYLYADQIVGNFMEAMNEETTLIVLSDHGFKLGTLHDDPSKTRDMRRVSEKYHTMEGILYMYGKRIKPSVLINRPSILDIAPTLLALNGLPQALDMPGRVLSEALDFKVKASPVATYEEDKGTAAKAGKGSKIDSAILERLASLGYLNPGSPKGDRNLAAIHFQAGRYEEAAKAYKELVREDPDDGSLHASLAGTLGALGRYGEALESLKKAQELNPLNPEIYHNKAVIYERRKDRDAAVREYGKALRVNPGYEPSLNGLKRLGVSDTPMGPKTPAEKLAALMTEKAQQAAKSGDYKGAMEQIKEAERTAPDYAIVYQYKANVAFLMKDFETARAALQKGLELKPDDVLFRANLKKLRDMKIRIE